MRKGKCHLNGLQLVYGDLCLKVMVKIDALSVKKALQKKTIFLTCGYKLKRKNSSRKVMDQKSD